MYENPFITATSRSLIADIYKATHSLGVAASPTSVAALTRLFNLKTSAADADGSLYQALRGWTDVTDIFESESFGAFLDTSL